jgi:PilZ domain-containing protein
MPAFAERRQTIRIAVRGRVTVETATPGPALQLVDVGTGGFAVRSGAPIPIGFVSSYRFATPDRRWAAFLDASAVHCKMVSISSTAPEYVVGLEFVNVEATPAHRELMALMDRAMAAPLS